MKSSTRFCSLALLGAMSLSVLCTRTPVQAQATAQGTEQFVREEVATAKVTARQLRMVWTFLRFGRINDPADDIVRGDGTKPAPKPIIPAEAQLVRHLAKQFKAFNIYEYTDALEDAPDIKPGDLLVQFVAWDTTGGVVATKTWERPFATGKALVCIENPKELVDVQFRLSLAEREAEEWPIRPGLFWLRPLTSDITAKAPTPNKATPTIAKPLPRRIDIKQAAQHAARGDRLFNLKRWAEAEAEYRAALQLNPHTKDGAYQNGIGTALSWQNKQEEAGPWYRRAIAVAPQVAIYHHNLGILLDGLSRSDAEQPLREAVRLAPNNAGYRNSLALLLFRFMQYGQAEEHFREAIRVEPNNGQYHANFAHSLLRQNRKKEAFAPAQKAIALGHKSHPVYQELGLTPPN